MAQGRPRFSTAGGFARAYDPAKSRDYKDYIRLAAAEQVKGQAPLDGALMLSLKVYRAIPKGFSKKKADAAERGEIRPITKPDLDNYVKGIKDALRSICWHDDSQIVAYKEPFGKYYSEKPRIEIEVETIKAASKELNEHAYHDLCALLSEIDRLTKDNAEMTAKVDRLTETNKALESDNYNAELNLSLMTERAERAERERDAAVDCIEKIDKWNNALGSAVIDDKITAWRGVQGGEGK